MNLLTDIISRLEACQEPSRELDIEILLAAGCTQRQKAPFEIVLWPDGRRVHGDRICVTASVDAAMALVERALPGWNASAILLHEASCEGHVWEPGHVGSIQGKAPTPALALCLALCRALEAGGHG